MSKKIKVFYSWLSDLPVESNQKLIRSALKGAALNVDEDDNIDAVIDVDEATRNRPGSPNISQSIFDKISESDIFVCDVSIVEKNEKSGRSFINSNVSIELGYAIALLGWERIVMVQNSEYGSVEELPFDIRGYRVTSYRFKNSEAADKRSVIGNLKKILTEAITLIVTSAVEKPQSLSPTTIQHQRDLSKLKEAVKWLNIGMLEKYCTKFIKMNRLDTTGSQFSEFFNDVISRPSFQLYDKKLEALLKSFDRVWDNCTKHLWYMERDEHHDASYFRMPGDFFQSKAQEKAYNYTKDSVVKLYTEELPSLIAYIQEHYIEIDLETMGCEMLDWWHKTADS